MKPWINALRAEVEHEFNIPKGCILWRNLPDPMYSRHVGSHEFLSDLSEEEIAFFLLLVCEAEED
jgi:hypothetical protein